MKKNPEFSDVKERETTATHWEIHNEKGVSGNARRTAEVFYVNKRMICYLLSRGKLEVSPTSQRKPQLNRNNLSSNELYVFQFKLKQSKASKPRLYGQIDCDNSTLQQERSRQYTDFISFQ